MMIACVGFKRVSADGVHVEEVALREVPCLARIVILEALGCAGIHFAQMKLALLLQDGWVVPAV